MNWQDIIQENRKIIRNGIVIIALLVVVLIGLLIANQIIDNKDKYVADTPAQTPATVSETSPSQYLEDLHAIIQQEYKDKMYGYQIAEGKLLEDGSWYITTIYEPQKSQWDLATDTYRIILHQDSNQWQIVAKPSLIFSYTDYPDIPREIIFSANEL